LIVVDSSALVAILRDEPEAARFLNVIASEDVCLLSSVTLLETSIVLAGRNGSDIAWIQLDALIAASRMQIVPQDEAQVSVARTAFLRYGKGRHPAGLNLGDCASYALARQRGLPLLFKGGDFPKTDLVAPS
jgi:ribonuclease VapC